MLREDRGAAAAGGIDGVQSRAVTLGIGGWGEVSKLDFIQLQQVKNP
jgi:hypothetical protein